MTIFYIPNSIQYRNLTTTSLTTNKQQIDFIDAKSQLMLKNKVTVSVLQCHMILQKSCWFAAKETFLIIINVENRKLLNIFEKNMILFLFRIL